MDIHRRLIDLQVALDSSREDMEQLFRDLTHEIDDGRVTLKSETTQMLARVVAAHHDLFAMLGLAMEIRNILTQRSNVEIARTVDVLANMGETRESL